MHELHVFDFQSYHSFSVTHLGKEVNGTGESELLQPLGILDRQGHTVLTRMRELG